MIPSVLSRLVILLFGTLYPAYSSYKAVRTKNVKEYVKWMMYWIVYALFTCAETFTDIFFSFWFPFYYEFKIILVVYLLSPATNGSSILYRKFVHPVLTRKEQEIDECIAKAMEQGYHTMLSLGSRSVAYATSVIMQTAIKGLPFLTNLPPPSEFLTVKKDPEIEGVETLDLDDANSRITENESLSNVTFPAKSLSMDDLPTGKKRGAEVSRRKEENVSEDDEVDWLLSSSAKAVNEIYRAKPKSRQRRLRSARD